MICQLTGLYLELQRRHRCSAGEHRAHHDGLHHGEAACPAHQGEGPALPEQQQQQLPH